jgi:hypothetical protein
MIFICIYNRNMAKTRRGGMNRKSFKTIPEIKASFDAAEEAAHRILREGGELSEQIKKFQKEWKTIFHRPVRADSAEAYLKLKEMTKKRKNKTRKQKQTGGMAPIDYAMRPGVSGGYGTFLDYQTMGSSPAPPTIGMDADCGVKNTSPSANSIAAVQKPQYGGSFSDFTHKLFLSPTEQNVPPSPLNNMRGYLDGRLPPGLSPAPYQNSLKM